MNTRSCLLTVGVSALLATGSVLTAAPASAAPGSAECVSAQAALAAQLGVASVDISLANQLRDAMAELEAIGSQLENLYLQAEQSISDELAAAQAAEGVVNAAIEESDRIALVLEGAYGTEQETGARLSAAIAAVEEVPPGDTEALANALAEQEKAQAAYDAALAASAQAEASVMEASRILEEAFVSLDEANLILEAASEAAFSAPEILALQTRLADSMSSIDAALRALGLTEGSDPQQLIALAEAAVAACSAPAVVQTPVAHTPVGGAETPRQQRGLNIQTAANDADAADPANLALLAGLAGFGAAASVGAVVIVRRRNAGRA